MKVSSDLKKLLKEKLAERKTVKLKKAVGDIMEAHPELFGKTGRYSVLYEAKEKARLALEKAERELRDVSQDFKKVGIEYGEDYETLSSTKRIGGHNLRLTYKRKNKIRFDTDGMLSKLVVELQYANSKDAKKSIQGVFDRIERL